MPKSLEDIYEVLNSLLNFEKEFVYFTFPADGSYKTLNKGTLVLDFRTGTAHLPDGTQERISSSLEEEQRRGTIHTNKCRSYVIDTNKDLRVTLDGKRAYRPITGNLLTAETYQNFEELHIKILNDNTKLFVWSCTNPRAYSERFATSIEVSSTGLATEGTINTIKTYIGSSLASGQIRQPFASALASREPYNIRNLTNSDQPGRSWSLTSQEIQTRVQNALASREPYNIRTLASGDTPSILRKFDSGTLVSGGVLGINGYSPALSVLGENFTIGVKKHSGPASMKVKHELRLKPGGVWLEVGEDSFSTDLVAQFDFRAYNYRLKNTSVASAKITVDYRVVK